jgi:glutathione S-transferase
VKSLAYFRDRIGVPRDMSYPAARQLRAHLNWVAEQL